MQRGYVAMTKMRPLDRVREILTHLAVGREVWAGSHV
jgi:hypothetical protein